LTIAALLFVDKTLAFSICNSPFFSMLTETDLDRHEVKAEVVRISNEIKDHQLDKY
jgi:hypothetical protein